jgi:hypothetical protein
MLIFMTVILFHHGTAPWLQHMHLGMLLGKKYSLLQKDCNGREFSLRRAFSYSGPTNVASIDLVKENQELITYSINFHHLPYLILNSYLG